LGNEWVMEQGMNGAKVGVLDQTRSGDIELPDAMQYPQETEFPDTLSAAAKVPEVDPTLAVEEKEGWHG
jgi:hypothetical protein